MIGCFGLEARVVERKRHYVVYLKEGSGIVDILNVMEAHVALMQLENVRIVKEMRNSINRRVNCETANITKTVSAAVRQIDDIRLIDEVLGLHTLPDLSLIHISTAAISWWGTAACAAWCCRFTEIMPVSG